MRDLKVSYYVQAFTYIFTSVKLYKCKTIRYFGWGQILKTWGQISAALAMLHVSKLKVTIFQTNLAI